jgi:hypothetical protein
LETEQGKHLSNSQQKNKVFSKANKNISFLYKKHIFSQDRHVGKL